MTGDVILETVVAGVLGVVKAIWWGVLGVDREVVELFDGIWLACTLRSRLAILVRPKAFTLV